MKVAVVGSRVCNNITVDIVIENLPEETSTIISGGAVGIDSVAREAAMKLNMPFFEILPDYKTFGQQAPLVRNRQIIESADEVIAFWDYTSKGTQNAILHCLKLQKPVKIISIE